MASLPTYTLAHRAEEATADSLLCGVMTLEHVHTLAEDGLGGSAHSPPSSSLSMATISAWNLR